MRNIFVTAIIISSLLMNKASAQQIVRIQQNEESISHMSDDFSDSSSLKNWEFLHAIEKYPSKIKDFRFENGQMILQPYASGWWADNMAPFLFKKISGNFDMVARIKVSGLKDSIAQSPWGLGGLMVREPKTTTSDNWQPRQENWLFLTTGVAEPLGVSVFEVKTTNNSLSNLKLRPAKAGWVEIRIVRVQFSYILLYRYEGESWTVLERFYRPMLPYTLQVGLNFYGNSSSIPQEISRDPLRLNKTLITDSPADMLMHVDYVRISRPNVDWEKLNQYSKQNFRVFNYTSGNLLSDYSITNEEVLKIIK